ncbi:hypothetical protein CVT24_002178 [Panaeolus cyanescens]|uniref:Xaa-Pro dipeptidyl-peptidase-like domain-containing protein n=1 Tax=Panaeolus cyanescens TaxID=181874 RepID=A0A409YHV8_9AGAR|nr:hypothetical protein CVT24_002178 [Panaeolus cyanescens]
MKPTTSHITIDLPSGIHLDASLSRSATSEPQKLAILLHPWSWLRGNKNDPVLTGLTPVFLAAGYNVLRYNSRGVGKSSGRASFTGFSEGTDLEEVIKWAEVEFQQLKSIVILGYSHGSLIASLCPPHPTIETFYILLSYPLGPRSWLTLFNSSTYTSALAKLGTTPGVRLLVVYTDNDEFTSLSSYERWTQSLTENVEKVLIRDASHFWRGDGRNTPLPDERPRASVANLIGRFENQTKRLSLSASAGSPSRSSSVVSHVTEDSSKVEAKEKREWPPKSIVGVAKPPIVIPPRQFPPPLNTQAANHPPPVTNQGKTDAPDDTPRPAAEPEVEQEVPLTAKALDASQSQIKDDPSEFLENWRKDVPANPEELEVEAPPTASVTVEKPPEAVTPTPSTVRKLPTSSSKASVTASKPVAKSTSSGPAKPPPSSFPKSVSKTPLKSPAPRSSLTPSASQTIAPLKPQLTGQSVASSAAGRRPAVKTPVTPSRAKTPTTVKTPLTRPKTPSSGLFAPTAASLARSRNAAPAVPTPVKKATLSSDAMDRLSKPTAASLSKAKASVTSPARPAVTRTPAVKPKTATTMKPKPTPAGAEKAGKSGAITAASTSVEPEANVETTEAPEPLHKEPSEPSSVESPQHEPEHSAGPAELPPVVVEHPAASDDNESSPISPTAAHTVADEDPTIVAPRDDLADIVNLLEGTSLSKPVPTSEEVNTIPDELLEIPDEDDKH